MKLEDGHVPDTSKIDSVCQTSQPPRTRIGRAGYREHRCRPAAAAARLRLICNSHVERWQAGQSANIASISSLLMIRCPPLQFASTAARADEGGVSFWLPGIYSSLAAVPPSPGFSTPNSFYSYSGDAGGDRNFDIGGLVAPMSVPISGGFSWRRNGCRKPRSPLCLCDFFATPPCKSKIILMVRLEDRTRSWPTGDY